MSQLWTFIQPFFSKMNDLFKRKLRQEARGLADLYAEWAVRALDEDKAAPAFAASKLETATGDRLFEIVLAPSFLDADSGLTRLTAR